MNIQEGLQKIKALASFIDRRDTYAILSVIFTGIGSFYLGKLSEIGNIGQPVTIERGNWAPISESTPATTTERITYSEPLPDVIKPEITAPKSVQNAYVGSKTGSKYHLPSCPGAKMISEANKVWFGSKIEAEKAGYSPAGNCKGI